MFLKRAKIENPDTCKAIHLVHCHGYCSVTGLIMLAYACVSVYLRKDMRTLHLYFSFGGLTFSSYEHLSAQALKA